MAASSTEYVDNSLRDLVLLLLVLAPVYLAFLRSAPISWPKGP